MAVLAQLHHMPITASSAVIVEAKHPTATTFIKSLWHVEAFGELLGCLCGE